MIWLGGVCAPFLERFTPLRNLICEWQTDFGVHRNLSPIGDTPISWELFCSFEYTLHSGIFTPACGVLLWLALSVVTEESWRWCGPIFGPTLQARCAGFGLGVHRSEVHSHGADAPIVL
jgi:hypothetical protein